VADESLPPLMRVLVDYQRNKVQDPLTVTTKLGRKHRIKSWRQISVHPMRTLALLFTGPSDAMTVVRPDAIDSVEIASGRKRSRA
jgi:hypothetical protein